MTKIYSARWVMPLFTETIEDAAIAVEGSRIVRVGSRAQVVAQFADASLEDFGEAAILPGFVNCHTHLELTAMRGFLEPEERDFAEWLKKLTLARMFKMTPDDLYVSAVWGAIEAARAGVTCVGDASSAGEASLSALKDVGLRGIVYQEAFGPDEKVAREQLAKLQEKIAALRAVETDRVCVGVSPHAPYTVSAPLLELITDYALAMQLPVMMHAAESEAEMLFMREGRGAFTEGLMQRGIGWRAPEISTIEYLKMIGVMRARPLLAHCITVDERDIELIKEAGAGVAHCPKSNAKLGHGHAPFASFIRHDLRCGFGSDSVASNNICDILEEARFALLTARAGDRDLSGVHNDPQQALLIATHGGASAMNIEMQTGSLAENLQADLAIVRLDGAHQLPVYDPARALVFASSGRDVALTVVAGREIYREGRVLTVDEVRLRSRLKEIAVRLTD